MKTLLRRLVCLATGHRWSSWRLYTAHFALGVTKDACARRCSYCRTAQSQVIPFRRFSLSKTAR